MRTDRYQDGDEDKERALFDTSDDDGGGVIIVAAIWDSPAGKFVIANAGCRMERWHEHIFNTDGRSRKVLGKTRLSSEIRSHKTIGNSLSGVIIDGNLGYQLDRRCASGAR